MTINFQQVNNNNPFVVGQIGGSYNTGVSVGDIEELYNLLGYAESEDMASQLLSTAGFSLTFATPEIIKSIQYRDDVRAAYQIATNVTENKFEQFNLSNRFEDLLIGETKAYNAAQDGKNWFTRIFSIMRRDGSNNTNNNKLTKETAKNNKATTNMATNGVVHQALKITKDSNGKVNINLDGFSTIETKPATPTADAVNQTVTGDTATKTIKDKMQTVAQKLAGTANVPPDNINNLSDLAKIEDTKINTAAEKAAENAKSAAEKAAENAKVGKAASASVSNIKSVSKSVTKEAFSGWGIVLTTIMGLFSELPSITSAFKQNSNEGWKQLGKSAGTILISDVGCSAAGQILCGTLGFALGGLIGPVGASIGGAIGKTIGASVGSILGRKLSSWIFGKSSTEKQQEEQLKEEAKAVCSSQMNLQTFLSQAKQQAAAETDSKKAQQINAKIKAIESKLNSNIATNITQNVNPFVTAQ